MTTKKIYGPWIKWHGGECPVPPDTFVEVKLRCEGVELSGLAKTYYWRGVGGDFVRYRWVGDRGEIAHLVIGWTPDDRIFWMA